MKQDATWTGEKGSYIYVGNGQYQPYVAPHCYAFFAYSQLADAIGTTRALVRKDHRSRDISALPIPAEIKLTDLALLYNGGDDLLPVVTINYGPCGIEFEIAEKFADAVQEAIKEVDTRQG